MPRPRTFDETEALRAAVQVFWTRGYPATGVRELCDAMGIQSGSFYASFGSKSSLFVQALDRYVRDLDLPDPSPAAARAYLHRVTTERAPTGCLLALSAAERDVLEPDARAAVAHQIRRLDAWLRACLEDRPTVDADLLTSVALGLQVQHRAGLPADELRHRADRVLDLLALR